MSVLTLADAKKHLNITDTRDDAELQDVIDAAEAAISQVVGPLTPVTKTAQLRSVSGASFSLPVTPVQSVQSITGATYFGSTAIDTTYLMVDSLSGVVRYGGYPAKLTVGPYTVTYTAGWTSVPDDLLYAVKELVRHLWGTQRGSGSTRPFGSPAADVANSMPGAAYAFPIRVTQLLAPYSQPAIA